MDKINLIKEVLFIYGGTTITSLIFNKLYYNDRIQKAFDGSKRKLKFRDLSASSKEDLKRIKDFCDVEKIISTFFSIIPFYQVYNSITNITLEQEMFDDFFDDAIKDINKKELEARKNYLMEMKKMKELPLDLRDRVNEEDYLPNQEEFLKALVYKEIKGRNNIEE